MCSLFLSLVGWLSRCLPSPPLPTPPPPFTATAPRHLLPFHLLPRLSPQVRARLYGSIESGVEEEHQRRRRRACAGAHPAAAQRTPRSASASPEPQPQPNPSPNPNLLPCVKTLVTLRCKLKRGPGLAIGPLGAPEYESRLNSRSRVPLPTFYCIFYPFRWQSPAEVHWTVHVDCPRAQIQTFWVLSAQRPLQAPLSCPGVPRGYHHLNR